MLDLVLLDGSGRHFTIPRDGELRVGSGAQCAVRLAAEDVSRVHALIAERRGHVVVLDLGSKNGTYLNGRRIREAEVGPGDVVRFSSVPAQFMRTGEGELPPASKERRRQSFGGEPLTSDAIPVDPLVAVNELLGRWRRDRDFAAAALVLWLVEWRGMRGAAVIEKVGKDITVSASHGDLDRVLQDRQCLADLQQRSTTGPGVETVQFATGDDRVLAVSASGLPCLVVAVGSILPDACEVELWVNLLALARRLDQHDRPRGQVGEKVGARL